MTTRLVERLLAVCVERPCAPALDWLASQPDEATALRKAPLEWLVWLAQHTTSEALLERLVHDLEVTT